MKIHLHVCIVLLMVCHLALQTVPSIGQEKPAGVAKAHLGRPVATREISKDAVMEKFRQLAQTTPEIRVLEGKLRTLQFSPATAPQGYWGKASTYERIAAGRPERLIAEMYVRDYIKQNSKDAAGLVQVMLTSSSGKTKTYSFYLIAPGGDFKKLQEYAVTNGVVALQHSWWTCVKCQLQSVGLQCAEQLVTCAPSAVTVVGYLACVAIGCGEAAAVAGACCACNGDWWCKWALGDCSQSQQCSGPNEVDATTCTSNAQCRNGWICQTVANPNAPKVTEPSAQGAQPPVQTKICVPPSRTKCATDAQCKQDEHCYKGECWAY